MSDDTLTLLERIVSLYGFPIFVCAWFMFRYEKLVKELTEAITALKEAVDRQ